MDYYYYLSPSKSFKPSADSKASSQSDADENAQSYQRNFHISKKPMAKNYMSPTISAVSKAITPRKKILTERNEGDQKLGQIDMVTPTLVNQVTDDESLSRTPNRPTTKSSMSLSLTKKIVSQTHDQIDPLMNEVADDDSVSRNPDRPMTKNFMSESPRKKIISQTHDRKIDYQIDPPLNSVTRESLSQTKPPSPPVSLSKNEEDDAVFGDSSRIPYDPLTNYLSPRPQFLRYKPNRRRAVLFPGENGSQVVKDDDSSARQRSSFDMEAASNCTSLVSSPSSSDDGSVNQEDEEIDETDDEVEQDDHEESDDEEEEKGLNLKWVLLKTLLLLVFSVLSASCISSLHSSTPVSNLEFPVGIKDGYCNVQNNTFDASLLKKLETGKFVLDQREEKEIMGFMEVNKNAIEKGIEEENIVEAVLVKKHDTILPRSMYQQGGTQMLLVDEGMEEEERIEDGNSGFTELAGLFREAENFEIGETEGLEEEAEGEKKGIDDELGEVVEEELQNQGLEDVPYQIVENLMHQGIETAEIIESSNGYLISSLSEQHHIASDMIHAFVENEVVIDSAQVYNDGTGEEEMVESRIESVGNFTNLAGEVVSERMNSDISTGIRQIVNLESKDYLRKELIKITGTENLFKLLTWGVMMFSVIVATWVLGSHFKHKANSVKKDSFVEEKPSIESAVVEPKKFIGKYSSLTSNPYSEAVVAEKCTSVLSSWRDKQLDQQLSSFRNNHLLASFHLSDEVSEEYCHSRVPTVEFLGEVEVGEVSSSLRRSVMKNNKTVSVENRHSVSSERKKMPRRHGYSVSVQDQPARFEVSCMDSPSYGSYTIDQEIMSKEEGDGEVKVITTPLRRSSRIRNRSVTSP